MKIDVVHKVYFTLAGIPLVLFIAMLSSKELKGDIESFLFILFFIGVLSFFLGVWGIRLIDKSKKNNERVPFLGLATLLASSIFILNFLLMIWGGIMDSLI